MIYLAHMACLGIIVMWTCLNVSEGQGRVNKQTKTRGNNASAWKNKESYLKFIVPSTIDAVHILSELGDPIFSSKEGVSIQSLQDNTATLSILFTSVDSYPENMRQMFRYSYCQIIPLAKKPESKIKHAISCNLENLRNFDTLIRLTHAVEFINKNMRNDWAFMKLLSRIEREPAKVLAEAKPNVEDDHISEHLSYLLVFLLAHESWHLQHTTTSSFADSANSEFENSSSDLLSKITCRNYDEFARRGKKFEMALDLIPLSEEGVTNDPTELKYFVTTRAIWQQEIEADKYAASVMARLILTLRERGLAEQYVQRAFSETLQHFGILALSLWHSRLRPFAERYCSKYAGEDFYLTRCMCKEKKKYSEVLSLFGATHPPIVLRMYSAANELIHKLGIDKDVNKVFPGRSPDLVTAVNWFKIIDAITDVPLKLSMPECLRMPDVVASGGNIVQIFPDLAGIVGDKGSANYPGYPADEGSFMSNCLSRSLTTKKAKQK